LKDVKLPVFNPETKLWRFIPIWIFLLKFCCYDKGALGNFLRIETAFISLFWKSFLLLLSGLQS
jgi:hypothetical protein